MDLPENRFYPLGEVDQSVLVMYSGQWSSKYNYNPHLWQLFIEWSNFQQLENPLEDDHGNLFYDSEWLYMAGRTDDLEIKKQIAEMSKTFGKARSARVHFKDHLEMDLSKRVKIMKNAVWQKFDRNPKLKEKLMRTWNKQIIEYTYRWDELFWINQETLIGRNTLWKLLMQYRDEAFGVLTAR